MITLKELEEMSKVDIRDVKHEDMTPLNSIKINPDDSTKEKIISFIEQNKNPYFQTHKKYLVKVSYPEETNLTIDDCLASICRNI